MTTATVRAASIPPRITAAALLVLTAGILFSCGGKTPDDGPDDPTYSDPAPGPLFPWTPNVIDRPSPKGPPS